MRLFYIGKAARKYAQICRHDKTRQRRIRHLRTTAGCGVNALSGLQNRANSIYCRNLVGLISVAYQAVLRLSSVSDAINP